MAMQLTPTGGHSIFFFLQAKKKKKIKQQATNPKQQSQSQSHKLYQTYRQKKQKTIDKFQRLLSASPQHSNHSNISTQSEKKRQILSCRYGRLVYLSLTSFYDSWRSLPSDILFDAIIILPNVYTCWISNPSQQSDLPQAIRKIFADDIFLKLLQWKQQQSLLFCMLNTFKTVLTWNLSSCNTNVAPFWCYLSNALRQISDPKTYKTSNYNALYLNFDYYTCTNFQSKFNVSPKEIISALETMENVSIATIKEILFQSNASSLTFVTDKSEINSLLSDHALLSNDPSKIMNEVFGGGGGCHSPKVKITDSLKAPPAPKTYIGLTNSPVTPQEMAILDGIMDKMSFSDHDGDEEETKEQEAKVQHVSKKDSLCAEEDGWWFDESYANYDCGNDIDYTFVFV